MSRSRWVALAEVGSFTALRAMNAFYRWFGRAPSRLILWPIAVYFCLRHRYIRDSSRRYLGLLAAFPGGAQALGRSPDARATLRQVVEFATQIFDRMVAWGGNMDLMEIEKRRSLPLLERAQQGSGGILVGAHLGSFDLLRQVARQHDVVVNVLMYTEHAEHINAFFGRLDPASRVRVLQVDPAGMRTALAIRERVEAGEWVGILPDRLPPRAPDGGELVSFLGRPARFTTAPFALAAAIGCPLMLCLCLRTGDAAYEASAQVLFDGKRVPRRERKKVVREMLEAYVAGLEAGCLRAPYQWFNFFDFWA